MPSPRCRHVEFRLVVVRGGQRCGVLVYAGEDEQGMLAVACELSANGDAVAGDSLVLTGDKVAHRRFQPDDTE